MTTIRLSVIDILAQLPTRVRTTIATSHSQVFSRHFDTFNFF